MNVPTLKDKLTNWTDFDFAGFDLAFCLGLMEADVDLGTAKHVFWSQNDVGIALNDILLRLVDVGILEYRDEPDYQFRWNPNFKGSWE